MENHERGSIMKRTTLLTAALAIAVIAAATPAFAMRDPGAGGMAMYNYGPMPPRIGQAGIGGQYSDGMSLYQYVRSNPTNMKDPQGLWAQNVHELATKRWAIQVGYPNVAAAAVGAADNAVDNWTSSTAWVPYAGDQGYHFNRNLSGGTDSRMDRWKKHLSSAKIECLYKYRSNDNPEKAAKELGTALHPYQDWVAHGDYGIYDKGEIWDRHNSFSPQKDFGNPYDYPDDPTLDAKGSPDGRPAGLAMHWITTNWGMSVRGYAIYERGMKRYRLTMNMTKTTLTEFRDFVQKHGGCKCKKYFGVK